MTGWNIPAIFWTLDGFGSSGAWEFESHLDPDSPCVTSFGATDRTRNITSGPTRGVESPSGLAKPVDQGCGCWCRLHTCLAWLEGNQLAATYLTGERPPLARTAESDVEAKLKLAMLISDGRWLESRHLPGLEVVVVCSNRDAGHTLVATRRRT